MLLVLKKTWLFVKTHWKLVVIVIAGVVGLVLFRNKGLSFVDDFKRVREAHDKEIKKIDEARARERARLAENDKRRDDALAVVKAEYDARGAELDAAKRAEVEKIVRDIGDDPVALAERLSSVTGFRVVLPQE